MSKFFDRFKRMFIVGFQQILDPYYHGFAAQISFYMMLSIVPIFILIIQFLGVLGISTETAMEVIAQYTGESVSGIAGMLFEFNYIGVVNIVYVLIAFWAGSRASFAIARITNYTMTEGSNTGKNYFVERARAIIIMLLTLLSFILAIVILCYGKVIILETLKVLHIEDTSFVDSFWMWLRWPLGFILYFFIIGYNYYILPTVRKPFRTVMPGAAFAAVGILIVSWVYSFYTSSLVNYDIMYGALSSVVAIMIWFLLLSWVLILGIMCNKVLEDTSHPYSKRSEPPEVKKFRRRSYGRNSKFDMDPDDVHISTIKDLLIGGAVEENQDTEKTDTENVEEDDMEKGEKPINKQ